MTTKILPQNSVTNNPPTNHNKIIAWLTGLLTLLLALFSFILSFNALADLAAQHNVSIPVLFPFVVEFAVVIFSLNALHRSLTGQAAKWQWTLIILSSLLAGLFNIAHADSDILSKAMAAMPSLFLLLSFESFLSLLKFSVTRQGAIVTLDDLQNQQQEATAALAKLNASIERKAEQLQQLDTAITVAKSDNAVNLQDARQAKIAERRQDVLKLHNEGLQPKEIALQVGVKDVRTIKNDLQALNGQVSK